MIQLHSNELTFSFPTLDTECRSLLEAHMEETAPAFVSGFQEAARKEIERLDVHRSYDPQALETAKRRLGGFQGRQIADAYRAACLEKLPRGGAQCGITFQRTLRLPDDGKTYPLPAGLGRFPLRSVEGYAGKAPLSWVEKGGVILPMYQGEALWMSFSSTIPCALKLVSGSVNALTGEQDLQKLDADPQNYVVVPEQPWLDGFKVSKGTVRQFVAMPVGAGYTVSEQLAPAHEAGGLIIEVFPVMAKLYFQVLVSCQMSNIMHEVLTKLLGRGWEGEDPVIQFCRPSSYSINETHESVGLAGGGMIQQEIYADKKGVGAWSFKHSIRACIHTCNAMMWRKITGENPPHPPLTAEEYKNHKIPWFDYYRSDLDVLPETKKWLELRASFRFLQARD